MRTSFSSAGVSWHTLMEYPSYACNRACALLSPSPFHYIMAEIMPVVQLAAHAEISTLYGRSYVQIFSAWWVIKIFSALWVTTISYTPFAVHLRKMYIHLRQQLKLYGKYTFISTSMKFMNANELSITLFAYVLTFNSINGWTIAPLDNQT